MAHLKVYHVFNVKSVTGRMDTISESEGSDESFIDGRVKPGRQYDEAKAQYPARKLSSQVIQHMVSELPGDLLYFLSHSCHSIMSSSSSYLLLFVFLLR